MARRSMERGQALVIVVFVLVGLLLVVGLAVDGGTVFLTRRRMQNAADAAALGGARELAELKCDEGLDLAAADEAIWAEVQLYAGENGVRDPANDVVAAYVKYDAAVEDVVEYAPQILVGGGSLPGDAIGVVATTTIQYRTFLMPLIGIDEASGMGDATAVVGPPVSGGGGLPVIMDVNLVGGLGYEQSFNIEFCSPNASCGITLADGSETYPDGTPLPAQRGWLNLEYIYNIAEAPDFPRVISKNSNTADVRDWIRGGPGSNVVLYAGAVGGDDGDFIHAIPGERTDTVRAVCEEHLNELLYIPLFDRVVDSGYLAAHGYPEPDIGWPGAGSDMYHVVGFVGFNVQGCQTQGNVKSVQGQFVEAIIGAGRTSPNVSTPDMCVSTGVLVVSLWD